MSERKLSTGYQQQRLIDAMVRKAFAKEKIMLAGRPWRTALACEKEWRDGLVL